MAGSYKRHGWLATLAEEAVARRCLSIEWESSRVNACIIRWVKSLLFQTPLTVYGPWNTKNTWALAIPDTTALDDGDPRVGTVLPLHPVCARSRFS